MTNDEPIDGGLVDPATALDREVDILAQRFPEVGRDEIDQRVHDTYDEVTEDATVKSHLSAVTENKVTNDLLADPSE